MVLQVRKKALDGDYWIDLCQTIGWYKQARVVIDLEWYTFLGSNWVKSGVNAVQGLWDQKGSGFRCYAHLLTILLGFGARCSHSFMFMGSTCQNWDARHAPSLGCFKHKKERISNIINWVFGILEFNDNEHRVWIQTASAWILALALTRCVAFGSLLNKSLAEFLKL